MLRNQRTVRKVLVGSALLLVSSLWACAAAAQPAATLDSAEAAYLAVDFDGTRTAARDALATGQNDRAATLRLYTLLGIANSAVGNDADARAAFRRVIALEPDARLDKTLSPKIRAPYLEVRGELTARGDVARLDATLTRRHGHLSFALRDPAAIVRSIDIAYRGAKSERVTRFHLARELSASVSAALPDSERLEYTLTLRDEFGNPLFRRGSEETPEPLEALDTRRSETAPKSAPHADAGPYYLTAGLLASAAAAAGTAGAVFHVRREKAAAQWNGASCERAGASRGEQCATVDERRQGSERLAIGFYAGGGALLLGSMLTLLIAPSASAPQAHARTFPCRPGVAALGTECTLAF